MQATSCDTARVGGCVLAVPFLALPTRAVTASDEFSNCPPLRARAYAAYQIERDEVRERERVRRESEARKQRDALLQLMRDLLGESMKPEAITVLPDAGAMFSPELTVAVDDLAFRVRDDHSGNYSLEVLLMCETAAMRAGTSSRDLAAWGGCCARPKKARSQTIARPANFWKALKTTLSTISSTINSRKRGRLSQT